MIAKILAGGVIGLFIAAIVLGCLFLSAWVLEIAWNYVGPSLFHFPTVTFWQAFAITVMLSFIGGFFKSSK